MDQQTVFFVLSVLQAVFILIIGGGAKIIWSILQDLKRSTERLENRVNALEVNIAKFDIAQKNVEKMLSAHSRQVYTLLEEHRKLILDNIKGKQ